MSPIDARIPLQTRTPQIQSPMDAYSRALHMRGQRQQYENLATYGVGLQQENAKREREAQGLRAYTEILRKYTTINPDGSVKTDPTAIRGDLLRQGYPELAKKYEDARRETQKKATESKLKDLQYDREQIELIGRLAGPIVNAQDPAERPALYQSVLSEARSAGAELPDEYSDDLLPELTGMFWGSMTAKEQLDDEFRRREQRTAKQKEFQGFYSNFLEVEGKPRNAKSEMEAREAFPKLGDPPEGRTKTVGNRIMKMNDKTGNYDIYVGPRPPSQRASATPPDEQEKAGAEYQYQTRITKHNDDEAKELQALREQATMYGSPSESDIRKADKIRQKYGDLRAAAKREFEAILGHRLTGTKKPSGNVPMFNPATGEFE